ncbi:MAG: hypothetical protein NTU53_00780 [Planctomycetota bacterium]|nr:hypothetical protein [Planctomycetota bacterium]
MKFQWVKDAMLLAVFAAAAGLAQAKNVDLSTVPARQGVQLTIYNSEDLTLVRETRKVSFKGRDFLCTLVVLDQMAV